MHTMFKRLLALVLILAMALCVVGCEEPEEDAGTSSQPTGISRPTNPSDPGASQPQFTPDLAQTAYIIGDHQISAVMLNFFYIDAIINYCNQYSYYLSYIMDIDAPLNGASNTDKDGKSWADKFLEMAVGNLTLTYQLYDQALTHGHKLTQEEIQSIDSILSNLQMYATYYGFKSADEYLSSTYGFGATAEAYRAYCEVSTIANSYYAAYADELVFDDAALRAYEADKYWQYNSYSYNYYYVNANSFLSSSSPSAEEKAAAVATAQRVAEQLAAGQYANVTEFDVAITKKMQEATGKNDQQYYAVTETDVLYDKLKANFAPWLSDTTQPHQEGDLTYIANESGSGENKTVNGYYVLRLEKVNENKDLLKNVRHLLVTFKSNAETDKAAAKKAAMDLLAQFEQTDKSEATFAELAKKHTDDGGSKANGGLYEDIYPGQMVLPFEQWCFEEGRQHGDYGLVETEYGWHIMFFVSDSQTTFRDFMVETDLRNEQLTQWLKQLEDSAEVEMVTTAHVNMSLKIKDL